MLGYCKVCDKLVSLRRVDNRATTGRVDYFPVTHDTEEGYASLLRLATGASANTATTHQNLCQGHKVRL